MIIRDIVYTFAAVLAKENVKKPVDLILQLKGLPADCQVINAHLDGDFFDETEPCEVRSASIDLTVNVDRRIADVTVLDMAIEGVLTIPCDRCMDDMEHRVSTTYHLSVKPGDEYDDSVDNVLTVPSRWKELDLSPIVRDTVMLTIPVMHAHEDPETQCNPEVLKRIMGSIDSEDEAPAGSDEAADGIDPRWDALRSLADNQSTEN